MARRLCPLLLLSVALLVTACGGGNTPPTADAGSNQLARVGEEVALDGSSSSDSDGDTLSYSWSLASSPAGSAAAISAAETAEATFVPDTLGDYQFELLVSDGASQASDSAQVTVEDNLPPVASAGPDEVVDHGDQVELDGSASSDPDGDRLDYVWRFLGMPASSTVALGDSSSRTPRFTPDAPGEYRLELTVSDGAASASDEVIIRSNRAPVANAGRYTDGLVGVEFILNGTGSVDPDGDDLGFSWLLLSKPGSSGVSLQDESSPSATFTPDEPGIYLLQLRVDDGAAQDTDQINVNVLRASGVSSTTIYVSPDGDDSNPGTEAEPLATFGAALTAAEATPEINRIRLGSGTYDAEPFNYETDANLQIVGPAESDPPAVLSAGAAEIVEVSASGLLQFVRVDFDTNGTAVSVTGSSGVSLADVVCSADICVSAWFGANVSVARSTLTANTTAVAASFAGTVTITESTLQGVASGGILIFGSALTVLDSTVQNSAVGVQLTSNPTSNGAMLDGNTLTGNDIGLLVQGSKDVKVKATDILNSDSVGVEVVGGALGLSNVLIDGGSGNGLVVGDHVDGTTVEGSVVVVRGSSISDNDARGVVIDGERSSLDLGTATVAGNNDVSSNGGYQIWDARPSGAGGVVTMSATTVAGSTPSPGPLSGPDFYNGIGIKNTNEVMIY